MDKLLGNETIHCCSLRLSGLGGKVLLIMLRFGSGARLFLFSVIEPGALLGSIVVARIVICVDLDAVIDGDEIQSLRVFLFACSTKKQ